MRLFVYAYDMYVEVLVKLAFNVGLCSSIYLICLYIMCVFAVDNQEPEQ